VDFLLLKCKMQARKLISSVFIIYKKDSWLKITFKVFLLIVVLFQYAKILSHGFVGHTLVSLQNNQNFLPIKHISSKFFKGQKPTVDSYKEKSKTWKVKPVKAVAYCQSNAFFELDFVNSRKKLS